MNGSLSVSVYIPYDGTASGLEAYSEASQELIAIFDGLASQPDVSEVQVTQYSSVSSAKQFS